ncbi:transient receptor potential cation channel protein painless-like [Periplaneta americana]|uniref:transient receptor potential cation channel protein painless-like n=1 Tax=Periplaneta americana TaxID=6978 RepID=UPI0037E84ACF
MTEEKVELNRMGSLCSPDPHAQLLDAWLSRNLSSFCDVLKQVNVFPDNFYDDPYHATCLYLACKEEDGSEYVKALLDAGSDANSINRVHKKAPIHVAVDSARDEVLKVLLSNSKIDINIKDNFGNTPLHVIAKHKLKGETEDVINKYKHCIQLLMNQDGINPNIVNRKGYTALHFAAQNDAKDVVQTILEHAGDDIDVDNTKALNGKTARETIIHKWPEFAELLPEAGNVEDRKRNVDVSVLFNYLYHRDCSSFVKAIENLPTAELEKGDGSRTLLQYCAENGLTTETRALLDRGVNVNTTCPTERRPPALLACYSGHPNVLLLFLERGPECLDLSVSTGGKGTAFHAVLTSPRADTATVHRDYKGCLDLLFKYLPNLKLDINATDMKGNTALHYAAKNEDEYAVSTLLKHGAYIGIKNVFDEPPLANISPRMLESFLNECLDTNGEFPREDSYEVTFSYKFLVPPQSENTQQRRNSQLTTLPLYNSQDAGEPPVRSHSSTTITETEPLLYISRSRDLRYLLKHPIFTSFLDLKWHRIRIFFYVNLIFYILFVALLTLYILLSYGRPQNVETSEDTSNTSLINRNTTAHPETEIADNSKENDSGFSWGLLIFFLICLILRELFQFLVRPVRYLNSPENYLELLLILATATILFCGWVHIHARPHVSAVAILASWAELVLLIGRHPRLSTNIEMFKTVSWNFLKFLAWYAILIVAFALSFYTLFRDCGGATECGEEGDSEENFFLHPGNSVFKTVVMLTGEFDAASIPFVSFPGTSHVVFVLFIFLIAIVLFNLLNGLAVSDTQAIRDDAEVVSYVSRVKLMSYIESLFQGSPVPFINTLKEICCCWPERGYSLKSFTDRVRLFPDKVPNNKIRVLPNRGSRILFTSHQKKRQELEEETSRCCPAGCGACTLDSGILKRAMEIINNRGKSSEMEQVKLLLAQSQKKMDELHKIVEEKHKKLDEYKKRFDTMEKSYKETEVMLEKILATLLQPSSSNSSLDNK